MYRLWVSLRAVFLIPPLIVGCAASAWAANQTTVSRCVIDKLVRILEQDSNTTTLRKETRWTVSADSWDALSAKLQAKFGKEWKPRDETTPGYTNVTTTDYTDLITVAQEAGKPPQTARLRIRSYGQRPDDGTLEAPVKTGEFQEYSKVELKIDHPTEDGVVYKPWIKMKNSDIALLFKDDDSYQRNVGRIRAETQALTEPGPDGKPRLANDPDVVDQMFALLAEIHQTRKLSPRPEFEDWVGRVSNMQYERESYQVTLTDQETGAKVPIQYTVDGNVEYRRPYINAGPLAAFDPSLRVIEWKVPLQYAKMSPDELRKRLPELLYMRELMAQIKNAPQMKPGAGKRANIMHLQAPKTAADRIRQFLTYQVLSTYTSHALILVPVLAWYYIEGRLNKKVDQQDLNSLRNQLATVKPKLNQLVSDSRKAYEGANPSFTLADASKQYQDMGADFRKLYSDGKISKLDPGFSEMAAQTTKQLDSRYQNAKEALLKDQTGAPPQTRLAADQATFASAIADRAIWSAFFGDGTAVDATQQAEDAKLLGDSKQLGFAFMTSGQSTLRTLDALLASETAVSP